MILLLHLLDVTIKTVWDRGLFSAPEVSHRKQIKYNSERVEQQQQIRNKRKSKGKKCLGSKKLWYLHSYLPFFLNLFIDSFFLFILMGGYKKNPVMKSSVVAFDGSSWRQNSRCKARPISVCKGSNCRVFFLCSTRVSLKSTGGPSFFPFCNCLDQSKC